MTVYTDDLPHCLAYSAGKFDWVVVWTGCALHFISTILHIHAHRRTQTTRKRANDSRVSYKYELKNAVFFAYVYVRVCVCVLFVMWASGKMYEYMETISLLLTLSLACSLSFFLVHSIEKSIAIPMLLITITMYRCHCSINITVAAEIVFIKCCLFFFLPFFCVFCLHHFQTIF